MQRLHFVGKISAKKHYFRKMHILQLLSSTLSPLPLFNRNVWYHFSILKANNVIICLPAVSLCLHKQSAALKVVQSLKENPFKLSRTSTIFSLLTLKSSKACFYEHIFTVQILNLKVNFYLHILPEHPPPKNTE